MLEEATVRAERPHIPWRLLRPGYLGCRRALERLRKFRALAIHYDRWATHLDDAPPLETLVGPPDPQNPMKQHTELKRQLHYFAAIVCQDLELSGITHIVEIKVGYPPEPRKKSLVTNFTDDSWDEARGERFRALMDRLDFAIGRYEERKRAAIRDWFRPLFWASVLLHAPVKVFEEAGLIRTDQQHSKFVTLYNYTAQGLIVLILVFATTWLAKKAGITVPWDVVTKFLKL